jgi:hypothetical protein
MAVTEVGRAPDTTLSLLPLEFVVNTRHVGEFAISCGSTDRTRRESPLAMLHIDPRQLAGLHATHIVDARVPWRSAPQVAAAEEEVPLPAACSCCRCATSVM